MSVLDTGIAYHLTIQSIDKASGLSTISNYLDINASDFVAVGDSENDKEMLSVAGESYAVANADNSAKAAADFVTDGKPMDGTIEALKRVQTGI
jgi:hydroxymethylpyrimidine pyrophosphatase-like HAD family hydrolase